MCSRKRCNCGLVPSTESARYGTLLANPRAMPVNAALGQRSGAKSWRAEVERAQPRAWAVINQMRCFENALRSSGSTIGGAPESLPGQVPTVLEMPGDRRRIQCVEHAALWHATLPRHFHTPMRQIQLAR